MFHSRYQTRSNAPFFVGRKALAVAISSAVILTACGGSGNDRGDGGVISSTPTSSMAHSSDGSSSSAVAIDYGKLKSTPQSDQALVAVTGDALSLHIKNGLRLGVHANAYRFTDAINAPLPAGQPVAEAGEGVDGSGSGAGDSFSQTNVHVQGVDEADIAKYDGKHWFVATYPEYEPYRIDNVAGINIVATKPEQADAEVLTRIALEGSWGNVSEMYLVDGAQGASGVAVLQNQWGNVYPRMPGIGFPMIEPAIAVDVMAQPDIANANGTSLPYPVNSQVKVQLVDVQDPSNPEATWNIGIEGSLVDSRKVGNTLYMVTRFDPWVSNLQYEYSDEVRANNEAVLADIAAAQLLPNYFINGENAGLLTDSCYLQSDAQETYGYASLVNITAINLADQSIISSRCVNSAVEGLSVSRDSLYLTGTIWGANYGVREQTVIHKFNLDETGANYAATGSVTGYIGHNSDPAFKVHEHNNDVRVVTTTGNAWAGDIAHHLWILEENSGALNTVANLPNSKRPAPIGKPGEDIYAVRFEGDKSHIVTFRRTDPLYTIDLSDRLDPKISGQLEVPGFATYMHPIGDDYLFALGQDADESGRVTSLKVALMDVRGDSPKEVTTLLLGARNSSTPALHNLKALSFLQVNDDELRIAMPVDYYQAADGESYGQWQHTGLHLFKVTGIAQGKPALTAHGVIVAEQADGNKERGADSYNDRGILHDDAVFYAHGNSVWAAHWDAPQAPKGPITGAAVNCDLSVEPALRVTVNASKNACAAKVTATNGSQVFELSHGLTSTNDTETTCVFSGADEQAGLYVVDSVLEGHSTESTQLTVYKDACHVMTKAVTFDHQDYSEGCLEQPQIPSVEFHVVDYSSGVCAATVMVLQGDEAYKLEGEAINDFYKSAIKPTDAVGLSLAVPSCIYRGAEGVSGEVTINVTQEGDETLTLNRTIKKIDLCTVEPLVEYVSF